MHNRQLSYLLPALGLSSLLLFTACTSNDSGVQKSIQSLGTVVSITLYDRPKSRYFEEAFALVEEVHDLMSLEVENSDLQRLKEVAGREAVPIHHHTLAVLTEALRIAEISHSAFTPLIEPLVRLWDIGGENPRIPSATEIEDALFRTALEDLEIIPADNPQTGTQWVFLKKEGMGVDLGAIAKGYAADLVTDYLKLQGVERAILDFGGNIVVIGRKTEERPWLIGIQHPDRRRGVYLGTLPADDISIVTSGVYERYFVEAGVRYHHLLDIATGFPAKNGLDGVAIVADRSTLADGYSTAVFVLGLEAGGTLIEESEGIEAIFVSSDNRVYLSSGLLDDFILIDAEYEVRSLAVVIRQ